MSETELDGFKNGYNLRFFIVRDCPSCKEKDSFACYLVESSTFYCEYCDYEEEQQGE